MNYCLEATHICCQGYWEREVCSLCTSPSLSVASTLEETLFKKIPDEQCRNYAQRGKAGNSPRMFAGSQSGSQLAAIKCQWK